MKHISIAILYVLIIQIGAIQLCAQDGFRVYPYLQNPSPEAMTILWFSEEDSAGQLVWGKHPSGALTSVESVPAAAAHLAYSLWEDTTFFEAGAPSVPYRHRIRLTGLEPGTTYGYSVSQGAHTFNGTFRTSPAGNDPIRFMVYADSETEPESTGNHTAWIDPVSGVSRPYLLDQTEGYRNNLEIIRTRHPDLVLVAGDLTMHGGEQRDWDEFWYHNTHPEGTLSLAGLVPVLAASGNHDYYEGTYLGQYNQPGSERAINRYLTYFETPANHSSDPEQEGRYYSIQYGPVSLISLDLCNNGHNGSEEDTNFYLLGESDSAGGHAPDFGPGSAQYIWLEKELIHAQENALFTFVFFHHVPYSSGPHSFPPGLDEFQDNQSGVPVRMLTPLFLQYGVDAVFSGHDEIWERSEVEGMELLPDGSEVVHSVHFYDVGTGGDGLRGPVTGADNPWKQFLVHTDVPETWEDGILMDGGKHYGHLQVDIEPKNRGESSTGPFAVFVEPCGWPWLS